MIWLVLSIAVAPRRPGYFLGCAILSFQYDSLYNTNVIGPALYVLFFGFTLFLVIYYRRFFAVGASDYLIILFGAVYAVSAVYSPDVETGLEIAGRLIAFCIGYYMIGRFYSTISIYRDRYIFDFGVSVVLLSLVFGYLAIYMQESPDRLVLGEGSAVGFSQMLDIAGGFTLFYLLSISGNFAWVKRVGVFLLFACIAVLIIFNATRGTIIGLIAAFLVYVGAQVFQRQSGSRHLSRIVASSFMIMIAYMVLVQFSPGNELFASAFERLGMNFGPSGMQIDPSAVSRLNLLQQAWAMFIESPLLGEGVGSFSQHSVLGYPHSVFPELLAETGLIATTLFALIIIRTVLMALRLFRESSADTRIVLGIFFISLVHQQVSFALWMAKPLFLSMGVIVSLYLRSDRRQGLVSEKRARIAFDAVSQRSHVR